MATTVSLSAAALPVSRFGVHLPQTSAIASPSSSPASPTCLSPLPGRTSWAYTRLSSSTRSVSKLRTYSSIRCMAPDEEKMTKRSPLDFPIEWDRPTPGRRPDIFPQFSPMKVPLPPPLPADPPEEDEEEEEEKEEEEQEDKPDKEPEKPKE